MGFVHPDVSRSMFVAPIVLVAALLLAAIVAGATPAAADEEGPPAIAMTVSGGLVTLETRDARLDDVLRLLADRAGFSLELHGNLSAPVTRSFTDVPLERAIQRLARGQSVGFLYDPDPATGGARLVEVWVIESAPGASMARLSGRERTAELGRLTTLATRGDRAALAELAGVLAGNADPSLRALAADALSRTRQSEAVSALARALDDRDPSVRMQAVNGLVSLEREGAADAVGRLLLTDPDVRVRRAAAQRLASLQGERARAALQAASADTDPAVRRLVSAALRRGAPPGH